MSDSIIAALIGGIFTLLTAIVTILLQMRIGRPRSSDPPRPSYSGHEAITKQPTDYRFSAGHLATAFFVSALILVGVILIGLVMLSKPRLNQDLFQIVLLGGTVALLLFFAWGDAIFSLFARQTIFQLKVMAVFIGTKIAYIIQYRQDCLNGTQYRAWFCPNMGLRLYFDLIIHSWRFWALMAVIGGIAVEVMHRARNR